jgi:shikimate kinase
MIRLIGPGGAGKSTIGAVLADSLALPFLDLDRTFVEEHADIDHFIGSHGYHAYARANVEVYRTLIHNEQDGVLALSSGFMTYPPAINREYADLRRDIERSTTTSCSSPHSTWGRALPKPCGGNSGGRFVGDRPRGRKRSSGTAS